MTKQKQAISFLIFSAMAEVMLDLYSNTTNLKHFDPLLLNKWKNIKPELEKLSKKVYTMFNEEEIKTFYHLTNVLEFLAESANTEKDFTEIMGILSAWKANDVTIINTREELIKVVNESETFSVSNSKDYFEHAD